MVPACKRNEYQIWKRYHDFTVLLYRVHQMDRTVDQINSSVSLRLPFSLSHFFLPFMSLLFNCRRFKRRFFCVEISTDSSTDDTGTVPFFLERSPCLCSVGHRQRCLSSSQVSFTLVTSFSDSTVSMSKYMVQVDF